MELRARGQIKDVPDTGLCGCGLRGIRRPHPNFVFVGQAPSGSVPGRMLPKLAMNLCPAD